MPSSDTSATPGGNRLEAWAGGGFRILRVRSISVAMKWQTVLDDVWLWRDSCNVYAVRGPEGMVIVNAGTGAWREHVGELPARPAALLLTHYFRDHAAGAIGIDIPVYCAEYDREILTDPQQHFRERETYIIYDNLWDLFAPIEPIDVAGVMLDYATTPLAGLAVEAVPLPGATLSHTGYAVTLGGKSVVFCGEAIHSPGKLPRVAPLQYNYNDLPGAINSYQSAHTLRERGPDVLLPSLGEPMLQNTDEALSSLMTNVKYMCEWRMDADVQFAAVHNDGLIKLTDHVWRSSNSNSHCHFIISESGKAMAIDYGYSWHNTGFQAYSRPARRRALLHGLAALKQRFGIDRVDMVLVSHFHDDHVAGIPVLQRLFGTECWAAENFADLLEQPEAHCFPCTWPKPITVHKHLPLDEPAQWEQYTFHLAPMSGHTRFASLIGFEADGKRFAHTGDQYMYQVDDNQFYNRPDRHNYVYRNGALLDGYQQSGEWMLKWRPDVVISGHWPTTYTNDKFYEYIESYTDYYEQMHQRNMPLADDDTHFNVDSWGGWIWPYRTVIDEPKPVTVTVTVRNPYPRDAQIEVALVGPAGWVGTNTSLTAAARQDVSCELTITPNAPCRRQPFVVELKADGQPFGQVAEALITVGHRAF